MMNKYLIKNCCLGKPTKNVIRLNYFILSNKSKLISLPKIVSKGLFYFYKKNCIESISCLYQIQCLNVRRARETTKPEQV